MVINIIKTMDCYICLEEFDALQVTPCNHQFCSPCVRAWVEQCLRQNLDITCPYCRTNLQPDGEDRREYPVRDIVGHYGKGVNIHYVVWWEDGSVSKEPLANLAGSPILLAEYRKECRRVAQCARRAAIRARRE